MPLFLRYIFSLANDPICRLKYRYIQFGILQPFLFRCHYNKKKCLIIYYAKVTPQLFDWEQRPNIEYISHRSPCMEKSIFQTKQTVSGRPRRQQKTERAGVNWCICIISIYSTIRILYTDHNIVDNIGTLWVGRVHWPRRSHAERSKLDYLIIHTSAITSLDAVNRQCRRQSWCPLHREDSTWRDDKHQGSSYAAARCKFEARVPGCTQVHNNLMLRLALVLAASIIVVKMEAPLASSHLDLSLGIRSMWKTWCRSAHTLLYLIFEESIHTCNANNLDFQTVVRETVHG